MLESLPVGLREHVAQRNIEAVAALSPQAQIRLLEAVQAGLTRLPRAIEQLRADPDTSIADLLNPPNSACLNTAPTKISVTFHWTADLIQTGFRYAARLVVAWTRQRQHIVFERC